jgi:hypothetical protein
MNEEDYLHIIRNDVDVVPEGQDVFSERPTATGDRYRAF